MKRNVLMMTIVGMGMCVSPALAAIPFFDDFESGAGNWTKWPDAIETLQIDANHNHTPGGVNSFRAVEFAGGGGYASYHDFGATSEFVRAETWLWDDVDDDGTDPNRPVAIMLQLTGDVGFGIDYLQLGVVAGYTGGLSQEYATRTLAGGADRIQATGVLREPGFTKLAIEADAISDGGQVRYYINDALVDTSSRTGDLGVVRLGVHFGNNYDNIWYDDVSVTPEPASLLLAVFGLAFLRRRSCRR